MRSLHIYTDGSCSGNPGPGGWAYILVEREKRIHCDRGNHLATTNNRMELTAVIKALRWLTTNPETGPGVTSYGEIIVFSDSTYVVNGIDHWLAGWLANGWRTKKSLVRNVDLWKQVHALTQTLPLLRVEHVKGHANNKWNILCDQMARKVSQKGEWR